MSNLMNIASELSEPELMMESYQSSQSSLTCVSSSSPVVLNSTEDLQTWLQQASPVNPFQLQENEQEQTTNETCGLPPLNAYAWYDLNTHSWRTFQACLLVDILEPFSETWPRQGTTQDGVYYPQPIAERPTKETDYGLWPTPAAQDPGITVDRLITKDGEKPTHTNQSLYDKYTGRKAQVGLTQAVKLWPTPTAGDGTGGPGHSGRQGGLNLRTAVKTFPTPTTRDWRSGKASQATMEKNSRPLSEAIGGQLNPPWVEWLMGWPLGWTDLKPLAMGKFQSWQQQHGIY